MSDIIGLNAQ
jgi:hypothetical protein